MDASTIPKLQSKEINADGRPTNMPGIYVHRDSGQKFITSADYDAGVAQADALMSPIWKDAWQWTGEVPSHVELKEMQKLQEIKDATNEALEEGRRSEEMKALKKKALEEAKVAVK